MADNSDGTTRRNDAARTTRKHRRGSSCAVVLVMATLLVLQLPTDTNAMSWNGRRAFARRLFLEDDKTNPNVTTTTASDSRGHTTSDPGDSIVHDKPSSSQDEPPNWFQEKQGRPQSSIPLFNYAEISTRMKELLERGRTSLQNIDAIEFFTERFLSEESAMAVKAIRAMLSRRSEDHGVLDVLNLYPAKDVAASLYALSRLQRASRLYEQRVITQQQQQQQQQHDNSQQYNDRLHLLQELSHYAAYSTAAYGWIMDLALNGRLNRGGDEQTLLRTTGICKDDVLYVNRKSKTHLPAFFLAVDHHHKSLVLSIRGSWSAQDVLTDLCCTAEEYELPPPTTNHSTASSPTSAYLSLLPPWKRWNAEQQEPSSHTVCGHHGMLEAAMAVGSMVEDLIQQLLLEKYPDYSLVLVGHSMGGGVAALLHSVWRHTFPRAKAYLYGAPCVAPAINFTNTNTNTNPPSSSSVISVVSQGDPFRCLSIGHVADLTAAVAHLCQEPELRRAILTYTDGSLHELQDEDLEWCWRTMERFRRNVMTSDNKLFPPGRIFYISKQREASGGRSDEESSSDEEGMTEGDAGSLTCHSHCVREVEPTFFHQLVLCPRMFDISKHAPSLYETLLLELVEEELAKQESGRTEI